MLPSRRPRMEGIPLKPMPAGRGLEGLSSEALQPSRGPLDGARTLPAAAFTNAEVYQREVDRLFGREWLCAGRVDQIPETGDYFCLDLLDEKLVVVRGSDGEIRALSRICRHRAAEVAKGAGNASTFVCPYHAWAYHLDGRLAGAPLIDRLPGFDAGAFRLPEVRCECWEGWIFVNFDPDAAALGPSLEPLAKLLAPYEMRRQVPVETATYESPFNWKVLVDNFMEAYHHVATHRDTLQPILPAALSYVPDNDGPYSALVMPIRPEPGASTPRVEAPDSGILKQDALPLVAAVVYPFHLFAPSAESLAWYHILPEGHDRFTLRIYTCFPREVLEDAAQAEALQGMHAFTKRIHEQDIGACESVWRGLASRSFESGPLSTLEKAIWQFNRWWAERMVVD